MHLRPGSSDRRNKLASKLCAVVFKSWETKFATAVLHGNVKQSEKTGGWCCYWFQFLRRNFTVLVIVRQLWPWLTNTEENTIKTSALKFWALPWKATMMTIFISQNPQTPCRKDVVCVKIILAYDVYEEKSQFLAEIQTTRVKHELIIDRPKAGQICRLPCFCCCIYHTRYVYV